MFTRPPELAAGRLFITACYQLIKEGTSDENVAIKLPHITAYQTYKLTHAKPRQSGN